MRSTLALFVLAQVSFDCLSMRFNSFASLLWPNIHMATPTERHIHPLTALEGIPPHTTTVMVLPLCATATPTTTPTRRTPIPRTFATWTRPALLAFASNLVELLLPGNRLATSTMTVAEPRSRTSLDTRQIKLYFDRNALEASALPALGAAAETLTAM